MIYTENYTSQTTLQTVWKENLSPEI